ncbi:impB/mucB/samB family protein [Xylaria flabelliformis]|nr:impB/mucB/samB family protein [Xylaria flabelliformis]
MKTTSLIPGAAKSIKIPRRNDERVVLHFDYDCFYASVFENENPSLKSQPLGIKQKSILATCNYVARARGVKKLMLISEAQRICPDLILMNGEDLTRFRDVSKKLWAFLRAHSWNHRVERLGLDEVFLDVTDVIKYNQEMLNVHALSDSFFHLDRSDPVKGFAFDGSAFSGCVQPKAKGTGGVDVNNPLCVRLMLASHLAGYLRHKLDEDFGYTSSGGISTNKLLAKLAGSVNKPNNQTTLLALGDDDVVREFMDAHSIRKVPGIGSRIAQLIEEYILSRPAERRDRESTNVMVGEARTYPGMSADLLEQILNRPGAERGSGEKVWNFLHGVDPSEVKEASDVPTQISIEDTYMSRPLQTPTEVMRELRALATSLVRRMRVDLTEVDLTTTASDAAVPRWLAYPKTLRLSTRTKSKQATATSNSATEVPNFSRSSRSAALPTFVFQISSPPSPSCEEISERLVTESLLPLFRRLHPERGGGLNLALLNICVTNMVIVANETSNVPAPGRDIGRMFRTQEDKLREWTVYDTSPLPVPVVPTLAESNDKVEICAEGEVQKDLFCEEQEEEQGENMTYHREVAVNCSSPLVDEGDDDFWDGQEESDSQRCQICGHVLPAFAMSAHERFHAMDE